MKKMICVLLLALFAVSGAFAQGIEFFKGSFDEALAAAKAQDKKVFIDFYTSWCVYCKKMEKEAFPDAQVGAYFNRKFINVQVNAEQQKQIAVRYEVVAYPTLVIVDAEGGEVASAEGGMSAPQLLKWAQTELGDVMTYEQLYEKFRTDKNDRELQRSLLLGAADFVGRQPEGSARERWTLRVERLYADYRKQWLLPELMNPTDFRILTMYHTTTTKQDEVFEYVVANYPDVVSKVGEDPVDVFLFSLHSELLGELAQKGDLDYEKQLERIRGDLKPVYDALMKSDSMDPYTCMKYLNDASYYIYNRRNVEKYISLMDEYLGKLGEKAVSGDYSSAIRTLYDALDGKLPAEATQKGIEWIGKALQSEGVEIGDQMELLVMNGDCYKMLGDKASAKKCYNQAYAVSLQFQNPGLSRQIQLMIDNLE